MVSVLTKIFGTENLETSEDVVQQTFIDAIQVWALKGIPENPSGWLFRVAKNKAIDIIRRNKHSVQFDFNNSHKTLLTSEYTLTTTMNNLWNEEAISDDMLRMMFACSHPDISSENQITMILKTLCGFSTAEIAQTFLTSEETISKRLHRTKTFFRKDKTKFEIPENQDLTVRIGGVLNSIYLLFTQGYNSTHSDTLIRKDLMEEAMLLCKLITENKSIQVAQAYALMALMCFHSSRNESRLTSTGEIILLEKQDRTKWDGKWIAKGNEYMNKAAFGSEVSSYHIEAAIAFEHCVSKDFESTNWQKIMELYNWLCQLNPSVITEVNRAVIHLKLNGAEAALLALKEIKDTQKLNQYYLYHSLLGEIYLQKNDSIMAKTHFEKAGTLTHSPLERQLLREKLRQN
tara:strand:+ start:65490 stop:66698 length:1209 start_codon:yes stop_codon:yes gene_type:complete